MARWLDTFHTFEEDGLFGGRLPTVLLDVVAFSTAIILAGVYRWEATDLIWGLWASSLVIGYATIVATISVGVRDSGLPLALALPGGLGLLAFFTVHFGMFHMVHGAFLGGFFPPDGVENMKTGPFNVLPVVMRLFWPFVLVSLLAKLPHIVPKKAKLAMGDHLMKPYGNVVKMHLLIVVFAGLHLAGLSRYAVYPVLIAYFFPWREFSAALRGER
jgi:hypothetical protein